MFRTPVLAASAFVLGLLGTTSGVLAADYKSTEDFARQATIGNLFEIASSKLALQKSKDADVKAFAQQMITDHTKASADLKAALTTSKISTNNLPTKLDSTHQNVYNDLTKADASDFDDDYIQAQTKAHGETIDLFEAYAKDGDSTSVKQFANAALPTLKAHGDHINVLDEKQDEKD